MYFIYISRLTLISKPHIHTPISFLLTSLKISKNVLLNTDCKQIFTMSVTCNKEIHQYSQTSFYYKYRHQNNLEAIFDAIVVSTHTRTASRENKTVTTHYTCYFNSSLRSKDDEIKHAVSVLPSWNFTFQKGKGFHCHLTPLLCFCLENLNSILNTSGSCLNDSALRRGKKNCAALLSLPENIIGVHILNIFLQLSRSCLSAGILLLNMWVFCMVLFNQDIDMSRRLLT